MKTMRIWKKKRKKQGIHQRKIKQWLAVVVVVFLLDLLSVDKRQRRRRRQAQTRCLVFLLLLSWFGFDEPS
jgi:hypothetical protein